MIFDTKWEVEEWVDSLYSDFVNGGWTNMRYAAPDEKLFLHLYDKLLRWGECSYSKFIIQTNTELFSGQPLFTIWLTS